MGWWRRLFGRRRLERELDAELRFHVEQETARLVGEGLPPAAARRRALAAFGGLEPMREYARDARGTRWVEDLWSDIRYAARMMRRQPGFSIAAIVSLAVGIGANAAVFAVADSLLLRSLPVSRPDELAFVNRGGYDERILRYSHPMYVRFREGVPEVPTAAMSSVARMQVSTQQGSELVLGQLVSGNWFDVSGVRAANGRLLASTDADRPGHAPVAVLSHSYWLRRFGALPDVIGTAILLNGVPVTVIGVAAPGFRGLTVGQHLDLWVPLTMQHDLRFAGNASNNNADTSQPWVPQDGIEWLTVIARVPAAVGADAALARLSAVRRPIVERDAAEFGDASQRAFALRERLEFVPGSRGLSPLRENFTTPLGVLMGTVGIVLLIGCANLASLLLARGAARQRELALRRSLGAGRGRIVRQLVTESLVLAGAGGLVGIAIAGWGSRGLLQLASSTSTAVPLDVATDWRLVGFTTGVSLLTGVIFGLMPALRLSRPDLAEVMRSGGRGASTTDRLGKLPAGRALVVLQVALSLTLLAGAILLLRTFENLLDVDTGFERDRVLTARFDPRLAQITAPELPALYDRLLTQARAIPGAQAASLALAGPSTGHWRISTYVVGGEPRRPAGEDTAREDYVEPGYFALMGMPVIRGRDFGIDDRPQSPRAVVINDALARKFFGDRDPLGRKIGYGEPPEFQIVGIVRDTRTDGLRQAAPAIIYHSLRQHPDEFASNLYVRVSGSPEGAAAAVRRAMTAAAPNLAVREVVTLGELTARYANNERLVSRLTAIFGLLAVGVACVGLYATVSYSVVRRTNELGIRLALGAAPGQVRRLVLGETLTLVALGCAAGVAIALAVLGVVRSLLFGLSPRDPATLALSALVLLILGTLAGLIPAWRASRVDPIGALRQ